MLKHFPPHIIRFISLDDYIRLHASNPTLYGSLDSVILAYYFRPDKINGLTDVVGLYKAAGCSVDRTEGALGTRKSFTCHVEASMETLILMEERGMPLAAYLIERGVCDFNLALFLSVYSLRYWMAGRRSTVSMIMDSHHLLLQ